MEGTGRHVLLQGTALQWPEGTEEAHENESELTLFWPRFETCISPAHYNTSYCLTVSSTAII